jgi:hypothetical protein
MTDYEGIVLSRAKWEDLPGAYNRINAVLPPEIRVRMGEIMFNHMASFGPQGVFERMNNRTILQILAEYRQGDTKCVDSGEIDGVRYALYAKPTSERGNGKND